MVTISEKTQQGGQIGEFKEITKKKKYNLDEKICKPWKNIKKLSIFS